MLKALVGHPFKGGSPFLFIVLNKQAYVFGVGYLYCRVSHP